MSKLDEFKSFIKDKEEILNKIHSGELSWQKVYERYDLYGPNDEMFNPKKEVNETRNNKTTPSINNALKAFQDIDMDKISSNLQSLQKVLGIFSEFGKSNKQDNSHSMSKGKYKRYND